MKTKLNQLMVQKRVATFTLRDDKFSTVLARVIEISRKDTDDEYASEDCVTLAIASSSNELLFISIRNIFSIRLLNS